MSSDAHLRRDHGTPPSSSPYIDWGPDLPGQYDGGRARVLVANPTTLYLVWETPTSPARWRLDLLVDGHRRATLEIDGAGREAWLQVSARSRGEVHLLRDEVHVATLPFETPPDAPSDDTSERWGRLDGHGQMRAAGPIGGRALGPDAIAPNASSSAASSSSVVRGA